MLKPNYRFNTAKTCVVIALLAAFATSVWAHGGATGIVKERMDLMSALGSSMKQLSKIIRKKIPYKAEEVREIAKKIEAHADENMTKLFPKGSLKKPSEAKPEIWQDWAAFKELSKRLAGEARALNAAANASGPPVAAIRALGKTCTACHKDFRSKKK